MSNSVIQPPHLAFYSEAIRFNCEAAMQSIDYVVDFIQMTNDTKGHWRLSGAETNQILDHLQKIVIYGAAISRYFWVTQDGEGKLHKKRAKELRVMFHVQSKSYWDKRDLRNLIEHFEENLDQYLFNKVIVGTVIPAYVGARLQDDGVPKHIFKAFYIEEGIFQVLEQEFEIQPLVNEICKIASQFSNIKST